LPSPRITSVEPLGKKIPAPPPPRLDAPLPPRVVKVILIGM